MRVFRPGSLLLGLVVIALGVVWLLRNLGMVTLDIGDLFAVYWPVFLVIFGLDMLVSVAGRPGGRGSRTGRVFSGEGLLGWIILGFGVAVLGRNLGFYTFDFSRVWHVIWPLAIILLGWSLLRGVTAPGGTHWAVMSSIELKNKGWKLQSGAYTAFMGGVDLDLTVADIPDGETVLNLTAVMGGVDVKLPRDLPVDCQGTAVLGGVDFLGEETGGVIASRTISYGGAEGSKKKLTIRALAVMGGVEVKHA